MDLEGNFIRVFKLLLRRLLSAFSVVMKWFYIGFGSFDVGSSSYVLESHTTEGPSFEPPKSPFNEAPQQPTKPAPQGDSGAFPGGEFALLVARRLVVRSAKVLRGFYLVVKWVLFDFIVVLQRVLVVFFGWCFFALVRGLLKRTIYRSF